MPVMKRLLLLATGIAMCAALPCPAGADTIYQCEGRDKIPCFYFNEKPAGMKCRVYQMDRKNAAPKGAKCRVQRFRDTAFHTCEKDGISWYYNNPPVSAPRRSAPAIARNQVNEAPRTREPADVERTSPVSEDTPPELASMESRRMDGGYLRDIVVRASNAQGIPLALLRAVIEVESGANPDVVSPAGAQGLMQLMPVTAGYLDVEDPFDPEQNVMAGARLLRMLSDRFHGDIGKTVAAYYAGANAVRRAGGIPTRSAESYVVKVMSRYQNYSNSEE